MKCDTGKNLQNCSCTYTSCSRRGRCCECVAYHRSMGQMVGCYFDAETERTYDRSMSNFIRSQQS